MNASRTWLLLILIVGLGVSSPALAQSQVVLLSLDFEHGVSAEVLSAKAGQGDRKGYRGLPKKYHPAYRWGMVNVGIAGVFAGTGLGLSLGSGISNYRVNQANPDVYNRGVNVEGLLLGVFGITSFGISGVAGIVAAITGGIVEKHRISGVPVGYTGRIRPQLVVGPGALVVRF